MKSKPRILVLPWRPSRTGYWALWPVRQGTPLDAQPAFQPA